MSDKKNVAILYNSVSEVKSGNERDILADLDNLKAVEDVSQSLHNLGYEVTLFDLNCKTLNLLSSIKADVIFNLLEGFDNIPNTFYSVTSYVESLNLPITGTSSYSSLITIDKARTKDYLQKNRVPTPNFQLFVNDYEPLKYNLRYPLITKPNFTDASLGITQDSVVKSYSELKDRINYIKEVYKDVTLAEEYIDGRELDVLSLKIGEEIKIYPILEGIFLADPLRKWNICDFDHKWGPKSYCDEECPANLELEVIDHIRQYVIKIHKIFEVKGYMRLDIRLSKDNIPYIIEINNNPGCDKEAINSKLEAIGSSYDDFVKQVVDAALLEYEYKQSSARSFIEGSDLIKSS